MDPWFDGIFDATGRLEAAIPFALEHYLEWVEASGRVIRENKRGFIVGQTPKLLEQLHIDPEQFIVTSTQILKPVSVWKYEWESV